jgi:hypothetical protein
MEQIEKELERLTKKQKVFHKNSVDSIDKLVQALSQAKTVLQKAGNSTDLQQQGISNCQKKVSEFSNELQGNVKEVYGCIGKVGKAIEKKFVHNLELAGRKDAFEGQEMLLNEAIAMHLIREGMFDLADMFCRESQLDIPVEFRSQFYDLFHILQELRQRNLQPAIQWATEHRLDLEQKASQLEFQLHRLQFIVLLAGDSAVSENVGDNYVYSRGIDKAIAYARSNFKSFGEKYMKEIQRLMCATLYSAPRPFELKVSSQAPGDSSTRKHPLYNSPYADYLLQSHWNDIEQLFIKDFCTLLGLSQESPLLVIANIGASAIPTMIKMRTVLEERRKERPKIEMWSADELPVEIPLPKKYTYHSRLICPVIKEQTTPINPPMMLPCGHILSREALVRLCKGGKTASAIANLVSNIAGNPTSNNNNNTGGIANATGSASGSGGNADPSAAEVEEPLKGIPPTAKVKCPYCPNESLAVNSTRVFF